MRILLIKTDVDAERCFPGHYTKAHNIWKKEQADFPGGPREAYALNETNWMDYDLFVVDLANFNDWDISFSVQISEHVEARIKGGGVMVVFAGPPRDEPIIPPPGEKPKTNYSWLQRFVHFEVKSRGAGGREAKTARNSTFNQLIEKYKAQILWPCSFTFSSWTREGACAIEPLLVNKAEEAVALHGKLGKGHVFILPQFDSKEGILKEFVSSYLLKLNVNFDFRPSVESPPEWISEHPVVLPKDLQSKRDAKRQTVAQLEQEIREIETELETIRRHEHDLLWQSGENRLKEAVKWAFGILGVSCEPRHPIDLVGEYAGHIVFIEVAGAEGTIDVQKGRQIQDRIVNAKTKTRVKGILVGNPFRYRPLNERPPEKRQRLFSREVEEIAVAHQITLLLSWELLGATQRCLRGESVDQTRLLDMIVREKGLIRI